MSREFKPGDIVQQSGIYQVTHDGHCPPDEVTCIVGELFPQCNSCDCPRFTLLHAARHFSKHEHFLTVMMLNKW